MDIDTLKKRIIAEVTKRLFIVAIEYCCQKQMCSPDCLTATAGIHAKIF